MKISVLISITLILLFGFQNCGTPLTTSNKLSSLAEHLPFAYDMQVDHLAHMSCSNMSSSYDQDAFWTFKVGAYDSGSGLQVNQHYLSQTIRLSTEERIQGLGASPANSGAKLQLAIRSSYNYQDIFSANVNNLKSEYDFHNFHAPFDNYDIAKQLILNQKSRQHYFPSLGVNPKIELKLRFLNSSQASQSMYNLLSTTGLLTLNYTSNQGVDGIARSNSYGSKSSIYGRGYRLRFKMAHGIDTNGNITPYTYANSRSIASVQEIDTSTGQLLLSNWDCNEKYTFMIVKPQDVGVRTICGANGTEPIPTANQKEAYDALRKVLPSTDWSVDLARRCIVPKKIGQCYGNNSSTINYNGGTCDPSQNNCPHYVSICVRK